MFHPETWRRSAVSLRRFHKDARARKQLRGVMLLLLTPLLCMLYIAWLLGSGFGLVGGLAVLFMGWGVSAFRNRKSAKDDAPITLDLRKTVEAPPARELTAQQKTELWRELADLALLHAVLADRAGSEQFVQTKVLPEGMEVVTRRRHMELLREYGLYDRLGNAERDLLLLPDGHWQQKTISDVAMMLEPLRLLRWVLQVDNFLPTVGATMTADFKLSATLIQEPAVLFRDAPLVDITHVRTAITAAETYFYRCWAEGVRRDLYEPDKPAQIEDLRNYADNLHGKEGEDFLLGTRIVSRASDSDVRLATALGWRRAQILRWVLSRMYGEAEPMDTLRAFHLQNADGDA